jgi:hypothetical protein
MKTTTPNVQPQSAGPKTVNRTTAILSVIIAVFATAVIVTIANWFLYGSIHADARAAVVQDMQVVSKAQSR